MLRCAIGAALKKASEVADGGAAEWPMEFTITVWNLERRLYAALSLRIDCDNRPARLAGANVYFCP
jgi:hypothetical protein